MAFVICLPFFIVGGFSFFSDLREDEKSSPSGKQDPVEALLNLSVYEAPDGDHRWTAYPSGWDSSSAVSWSSKIVLTNLDWSTSRVLADSGEQKSRIYNNHELLLATFRLPQEAGWLEFDLNIGTTNVHERILWSGHSSFNKVGEQAVEGIDQLRRSLKSFGRMSPPIDGLSKLLLENAKASKLNQGNNTLQSLIELDAALGSDVAREIHFPPPLATLKINEGRVVTEIFAGSSTIRNPFWMVVDPNARSIKEVREGYHAYYSDAIPGDSGFYYEDPNPENILALDPSFAPDSVNGLWIPYEVDRNQPEDTVTSEIYLNWLQVFGMRAFSSHLHDYAWGGSVYAQGEEYAWKSSEGRFVLSATTSSWETSIVEIENSSSRIEVKLAYLFKDQKSSSVLGVVLVTREDDLENKLQLDFDPQMKRRVFAPKKYHRISKVYFEDEIVEVLDIFPGNNQEATLPAMLLLKM